MKEFLQFEDLTISYGGHKVVTSLSGKFVPGKVNLVVGRAGSGKSSLLLTVAGFHKEFSGKIRDENGKFDPSGNFSLAFQNPESLFFNATAGDEVEFALRMRQLPESEIIDRARGWLLRWGLEPDQYYKIHPHELSGGEKRRLALAACTVFLPPLILLDEPLAGLDRRGQTSLATMLAEMAAKHIVVVVTHEPEIFIQNQSRILFLKEGRGDWFDGNEFLALSLKNSDFYPLPGWYERAMTNFTDRADLPEVNATAVAEFLKRAASNANRL
ncbi:MAG: ABC transporter ATP-binding protein [Candidatus Riflebacteria bacterium]|nr:ABC transporter ATP-binding protein [Candidatus Riflebacteria bacterium]